MTTQYTPILKLALPVQGELSGTWGDVVNDNITSMIEQAIAGRSVVNTWSGNSHTLTTANGTTAEARAAMLSLTDTGTQLSAAGTVVCPALSKTYIVKNGAGQVITVKTASGSGIAIPNGKTMLVYCDGTNVLEGVDHVVTLSAGTLTITGLTTFASLKGADATTVTGILDEDNMASNSATKLATQQSIKAYVDAQVDTTDTLAEILAIGNTTGSNDIDVDAAQKVQFRDASIYINSSADGQLDIVADTEIQIATATVDLNGNLDVSGTALVTGTLDVDGATQLDSTLTVGVNDTGHDVKFFGATSGSYMLWDESADDLILGGAAGLTIAGDIDVDGTTNLDVVDIDGAVDMASTLAVTGEITANGGIDVTGTVTADGLTVDGNNDIQINRDGVSSAKLFWNRGTTQDAGIELDADETLKITVDDAGLGGKELLLVNNGKQGFKLSDGGDISFYEDTGSTAKFFWDASAERLGIGTTSPSQELEIYKSSGDCNVLISSNNGASQIFFGDTEDVNVGIIRYDHASNFMRFNVNASEAMRIDSSGNVLVGKTAFGLSTDGVQLSPLNSSAFTASSSVPLYVNRKGNDGELVNFRKDGLTVGSIGVVGGSIILGRGDTALALNDVLDAVYPIEADGTPRDAAIDLGRSGTSGRFKDLYLSGGVVFGTTGGSVSSKTLDDYEEGTWTPSFGGTGVNPSVSFSTTGPAEYVKVGTVVTASMAFFGDITAAGSGAASIQGLPFQAKGSRGVASINYNSATANPTTGVSGYIEDNAIICYLHQGGSTTGESWAAGTSQRLFFSITYIVD